MPHNEICFSEVPIGMYFIQSPQESHNNRLFRKTGVHCAKVVEVKYYKSGISRLIEKPGLEWLVSYEQVIIIQMGNIKLG